ncbi:MAG: alpha-amylase family protein, partial [Dysosmobacter sp.]|nr:alpha-amylase family protein [Dysosmobacter sp.]
YNNGDMFAELCDSMERFYQERDRTLKSRDADRESSPDWYKSNDMLGMMFYIDNFAGNMKGVTSRLDYIEQCNVNYIHLMPFLDTTKGKSDGGYAVSDFRKVQENLGSMKDLENLTTACHKKGINVCMDFVMNHTSEDHEWARRARQGDGEYMSRYFFYPDNEIPAQYERTVPQVFPTTAPGNFTWLPDCGHYVMTTFYPYQWDLNYRNPRVFNEMMYNFLYLANRGIDIIRIDAVPYIWKELGTVCRNLPQVHTLSRMLRMVTEIVCPSVLLLGEVVMEPAKVAPYFGTPDKPECHMLYNVTTMATTWHTLATGDVSLLKRQMEILCALPKDFLFLNYLRCHDDIGWGLDYPWLARNSGTDEVAHKKYLNDWFTGKWPGSPSRGELYNDDPRLGDARLCGTTASLCGVEAAVREWDALKLERAAACVLTLHAWMLSQSGVPVIYSGDEVGRLNDWGYRDEPGRREDSRYIHRGDFQWDLAERRTASDTYQGRIFQGLRRMEELRAAEPCFDPAAEVRVEESGSSRVLALSRRQGERELVCLFNFSGEFARAHVERGESYTELMYGTHYSGLRDVELWPNGFAWLLRD